jgi:hypothetical protein
MKTFLLSPSIVSNLALRALERVDLPAPEKPVNQKVAPLFREWLVVGGACSTIWAIDIKDINYDT